MSEYHPAAIQFGVPRSKPSNARWEAELLLRSFIWFEIRAGNTVKALEARLHLYPFCFQAFIGTSTTKLFKFFGTAAGPVNHHAINLVARAESKCNRQLRLGKIAGTTPNHSRLHLPLIENANGSADGVAIGLQPSQVKSNAAMALCLIVPVQICWTIVRSHQDVRIAVAVEIPVCKSPPHFGRFESAASALSHISKLSAASVQEELWRLRVSGVPPNASNGLINVAIDDRQVQKTVEVHVKKHAAEPEAISRRSSDSGGDGGIVEKSRSIRAIESDHLVVKVGDGYSGLAGAFEIPDVHTHAGACFSFCAESQASLHSDILELAVVQVAIQFVGLRVVCYEQVRPPILIVVKHRDAQRF